MSTRAAIHRAAGWKDQHIMGRPISCCSVVVSPPPSCCSPFIPWSAAIASLTSRKLGQGSSTASSGRSPPRPRYAAPSCCVALLRGCVSSRADRTFKDRSTRGDDGAARMSSKKAFMASTFFCPSIMMAFLKEGDSNRTPPPVAIAAPSAVAPPSDELSTAPPSTSLSLLPPNISGDLGAGSTSGTREGDTPVAGASPPMAVSSRLTMAWKVEACR
mmetsp:Transcript_28307/g.81568  ORF Transcript_28307/g.81568 Transcript_28307/m.81568 type:complete len:216 (-) Transcript_28307:1021-1668(-)